MGRRIGKLDKILAKFEKEKSERKIEKGRKLTRNKILEKRWEIFRWAI